MTLSAQESTDKKNWAFNGNAGFNVSQSYFTNWAAGGQSAINWLGTFNYTANYTKDNFKLNNNVQLALGYSYFDFKYKPIKTDDKIELTSLAALKATEKLNYSLELAFRSQFAYGYDYKVDSTNVISKLLAPAYISLGLGSEWVPNSHFSLNFSPLTGRITIVNDQYLANDGAYGVEPAHLSLPDSTWIAGRKTRCEFGLRIAAKTSFNIVENVTLQSKLELFSNYLNHPERVDVDWQNLIVMKINSWLNCNISTHLIYDYDVPFYDMNPSTGEPELDLNSKVQFKEVLSLGISVKL
jgi:Protein of unknown function (DUF3078).